jgi:hypothetical protein
MSLSKDFNLFGIVDLKLKMIIKDDDLTGIEVEYDPLFIDIPGVKSLKETPDIKTSESTGDEEVLDTVSNFKKYTLAWENGKVPLGVIEKVNGGKIITSGSGNAEKHEYYFNGDEIGGYFQLQALSKDGKTLITYYKVQGTLTFSMTGDEHAVCSFNGTAIRTTGTVNGERRCKKVTRAAVAQTIDAVKQIETATVVGTITTAGNATVIITAAGMTGSPKTKSVAVAIADSAAVVAQKIRESLAADTAVSALFAVSGNGVEVILTKLLAGANDTTLNISIDNGTCAGLTPALISVG